MRRVALAVRDVDHERKPSRWCYPNYMVLGMLYRAGVAIMLITTLLLPYGRCQAPPGTNAHDCCVHRSTPAAGVKANCCTVRSELPAVVVERAIVSAHPMAETVGFVPPAAQASLFLAGAETSLARISSPPGKSVLRI